MPLNHLDLMPQNSCINTEKIGKYVTTLSLIFPLRSIGVITKLTSDL